ncbi:sensor domain-containing diguanylate cyclase [Thalassotalea fusca]
MNKTRVALTSILSIVLISLISYALLSFDHRQETGDYSNATFWVLTSDDKHTEAFLPAFTSKDWQPLSANQFDIVEGKNWLKVVYAESPDNLLIRKSIHIQWMKVYLPAKDSLTAVAALDINGQSVFHLKDKYRDENAFVVEIQSKGRTRVSAHLLSNESLLKSLSRLQLERGFAIGGLVALAVTMFCVYVANGNRIILLLVGYLFARACLLSVLLGFNLYYWFPNLPGLQGIEVPILVSLSAVLLMWFCSVLFKTRNNMPRLHQIFKSISWVCLIYLPISMLLPLDTNLIIVKAVIIATGGVLVFLAYLLVQAKHRLANLFAVVIGLQFVFNVLIIATSTWYEFNANVYTAAYWLNAFLITFLLSRQYNFQIQDKHAAQKLALENERLTRKAQDELLALQQETQDQLASSVQERTIELNIALQELEEANRELQKKNTLDALTGLYNRRYYDQKLIAEFRRSRRNRTPLSLIVIDVDYFKSINDNFGHQVGDACLVQLATMIKQCIRRSSDIGCRYGGEEFCLILPETEPEGAVALAEELRLAVADQALVVHEQKIPFTISCGITTCLHYTDNEPSVLFAAADKALYQAKANGRNQVIYQELTEKEQ